MLHNQMLFDQLVVKPRGQKEVEVFSVTKIHLTVNGVSITKNKSARISKRSWVDLRDGHVHHSLILISNSKSFVVAEHFPFKTAQPVHRIEATYMIGSRIR